MTLPPLPPGAIDVTDYFGYNEAKSQRFFAETGMRPAFTDDHDIEQAYRAHGAAYAMAYRSTDGTLYTLHTVFGEYLQTGPNSYREERRVELRPIPQAQR